MPVKISIVSVHLAGSRRIVSFGRAGHIPTAYTRVTRASMRRLCLALNYGEWRIRVNPTGYYAHKGGDR